MEGTNALLGISTAIDTAVANVLETKLKEYDELVKKQHTNIKSAVTKAKNEFKELIKEQPIMKVQINNEAIQDLTFRAVPFLDRMLTHAGLKLNTLLVGPAGCGKTTAAKQLAEAMGLQFGSVCLTAGASETWLFGRQTPNGFVEGPFSKLYREGGVFLADEMDAADANLMLSINTALANGIMFNPMSGDIIEKHKDFVFVGAANTFGKGANHVYTGRNRLDGATLDRFVVVEVDYDHRIEQDLCPDAKIREFLNLTRVRLKDADLTEFVSTRWYDYMYRMNQSGVAVSDIKDSMIANWSSEAKNECNKAFKKVSAEAPKNSSLKKVSKKSVDTGLSFKSAAELIIDELD